MTSPLPAPGRWTDPAWRDEVLAWVDSVVPPGVRRTSSTSPHTRPWSMLIRLETSADPLWLKANGDGTRYEPAVLGWLAENRMPHTPRPVAVDRSRGLALLPDGGPTLREMHAGRTPLPVLERLLTAYATLQRATAPHADELIGLGIPDVRPGGMTELFLTLIGEVQAEPGEHGLTTGEATSLRQVVPAFNAACLELEGCGIPPSLQHDDLHDNNVLAQGSVIIDWGDAVVGHPFGTMLATLSSVAHHHGLDRDDPALHRLADAYTETWTDVADRATLRRQLELAVRVGTLTRALAWRRALEGSDAESHAEWGDGVRGWLLETVSDGLPLRAGPLVDPG